MGPLHNLPEIKGIALVAHDHRKKELLDWVKSKEEKLKLHSLYATQSTGKIILSGTDLKIHLLHSGPLGGDMEVGQKIVQSQIHCLIFFWDPLTAMPHEPDVRALLRVATLWNIPLACNQTTADFVIESHLFRENYVRKLDQKLSQNHVF